MLNISSNKVKDAMAAEHLSGLKTLQTPNAGKLLARWLIILFAILVIAMFLPWQQNIRGEGSVTAFAPEDRPQTVETAIAGRIEEWYIQEGMLVDEGDTLVRLSEVKDKYFDPDLVERLEEQIGAKEAAIEAKQQKSEALGDQIIALEEALQLKLANARIDLSGIGAEYQEKISKARSDLNATLSELFESRGELSKLRNEYANVLIRFNNRYLLAPQDGYIVRAQKAGIGETLKEGEAVVTIMPLDPEVAAEVYVRPMDVPLISVGREVRLEFEGWPALQFSGWPSVAVGTFGGVVKVIDYIETPDQQGRYRVLVVPDPDDEPWPEQLRLGSGVYGWILLDEVPVWYEIWRQLNSFPPSLKEAPEGGKKDKALEK